jgi:hypothetical protein
MVFVSCFTFCLLMVGLNRSLPKRNGDRLIGSTRINELSLYKPQTLDIALTVELKSQKSHFASRENLDFA